MKWIDASGTSWLFGGEGYDSTGTVASGTLNDLWKYSGGELIGICYRHQLETLIGIKSESVIAFVGICSKGFLV